MVYYAPQLFYLKISQNLKLLKKNLDAHTYGHFIFTVRKIFSKVFTKLFLHFHVMQKALRFSVFVFSSFSLSRQCSWTFTTLFFNLGVMQKTLLIFTFFFFFSFSSVLLDGLPKAFLGMFYYLLPRKRVTKIGLISYI